MESSHGQNGVTSAARPVAAGCYVARMLQSLRALGVDVAAICQAADIDRTEIGRPGAVVPVERLCVLVQASMEQTQDEYLGLHLAERTGAVGLLGYLCRASETVGDALEAIVQSLGVALSSAQASLDARSGPLRLTIEVGPGPRDVTRHAFEYLATLIVVLLREMTEGAARVTRIEFPHPQVPGSTLEYHRVLGCDVRFEQPRCAVVLPLATSTLPSRLANPAVARALRETIADLLAGRSLAARVAVTIRHRLSDGDTTTRAAIAQTQGLSVRSLERGLHAEGVSLRMLRRDTQLVIARDLLASSNLTIKEVAARVGFSGTAPFDRAFKACQGVSPQDFRRLVESRARAAHHTERRADRSRRPSERCISPRTTEGVPTWT